VSAEKTEATPTALRGTGTGNNKAPRLADDAYFTPDPLAIMITRHLAGLLGAGQAAPHYGQPQRILEPSCGSGAFLRAARYLWRHAEIVGVDSQPGCVIDAPKHAEGARQIHHDFAAAAADVPARFVLADFLTLAPKQIARADLVLGNPPYTLAEEFVRYALTHLHPGASVAFLLRLSFLGSQERLLGLHREFPIRWLLPIAGRPSFTPDGRTDSSEYAVFVWTKDWIDHGTITEAIEWKRGVVP
jgi:hypothetical protein